MEHSPSLPGVELGQIFLEADKRQGRHLYTSVQRVVGRTGFAPAFHPTKCRYLSQRCIGGKDPVGDTGVARGHIEAQGQEGDVPVLEECCTTGDCCRLSDGSAAVCGQHILGLQNTLCLTRES